MSAALSLCVCGERLRDHYRPNHACSRCPCERFVASTAPAEGAAQMSFPELREAELRGEENAHVRARVYDAVAARGRRGATSAEVIAETGLNADQVRARLCELRREGVLLVRDRRDLHWASPLVNIVPHGAER